MEQKLLRDTKSNGGRKEEVEREEAEAGVEIWKYVFGFTEMAVVKCAVELGIADVLESNGGCMSLSDLSSSLGCAPPSLYRIMRFLVHRNIFKQRRSLLVEGAGAGAGGGEYLNLVYTQTPLSRRLLMRSTQDNDSMAALILLETSPVMVGPWHGLSKLVRDKSKSAFGEVHGEDVWRYAADHPSHSNLINEAMACHARDVVPHIIKGCPTLLDGVGTLVDVGGGDATTLSLLLQAFPWVRRAINFDLPHVVAAVAANASSSASSSVCVEHVGGDMFDYVPKADVVFIMWVLHDWGDEECIEILKKCKEAIAGAGAGANDEEEEDHKDAGGGGKVIIVEAVIGQDDDVDDQEETTTREDYHHKVEDVRLTLDMVMMAHTTNGKERTFQEWNRLLNMAGFTHFTVHPIQAVLSVIQAYP